MKVLILGASGIIGSFMRLTIPPTVTAVYYRREADCLHKGCDLEHWPSVLAMLREEQPDVIVNLAGESRPDVVERDPERYEYINRMFPLVLARYTNRASVRMIHVSTQGVLSGEVTKRHYGANHYGQQKAEAEDQLRIWENVDILRPTFILGARPLPHVGRQNPLEQFAAIGPDGCKQVNDRWFSPCFAEDAAAAIWDEVLAPRAHGVANVGIPIRACRYELAKMIASGPVEPVSHDSFEGIAPRPLDTTYADKGPYMFHRDVREGMLAHVQRIRDFEERNLADRAREIALFLGISEKAARERLSLGFLGPLHDEVSDDWRSESRESDEQKLAFYRHTEKYIWELSAYHCDVKWNTRGQHRGYAEALKAKDCNRVLCLGDGIGELSLRLYEAGFDVVYHDLEGSRTAAFAAFRFWRHTGDIFSYVLTPGWEPSPWLIEPNEFDAIVCLDFLEHVPNVDEWAAAIRTALRPGGFFVAQNAFGIGSGPAGALPMHLACNDKYVVEWDPHLKSLGFEQLASQWYRKAA